MIDNLYVISLTPSLTILLSLGCKALVFRVEPVPGPKIVRGRCERHFAKALIAS